jgi:hypothetical protein
MKYRLFQSNQHYLPLEPRDLPQMDEGMTADEALLPVHITKVNVESSLSVVNGDETLLDHLGAPKKMTANILKSQATTDLVNNVGAMMKDLEELGSLSLVETDERMAIEAEQGILKETIAKKNTGLKMNQYQDSIFKEMQSASSEKYGYIVWLLPNPDSETTVFKIIPESFDPMMLLINDGEKLKAAQKTIDEEEEETLQQINEQNVNLQESTKKQFIKQKRIKKKSSTAVHKSVKKMIKGAKEMMTAARSMLEKIKSGQVIECEDFTYDQNGITYEEIQYYRERTTLETIISLKANLYEQEYQFSSWEPLPLPALNEEDIKRIDEARQDHLDRAQRINSIAEAVLVKKGQNKDSADAFISGATKNKIKKTNAKKQKRQQNLNNLTNNILMNADGINCIDDGFILIALSFIFVRIILFYNIYYSLIKETSIVLQWSLMSKVFVYATVAMRNH